MRGADYNQTARPRLLLYVSQHSPHALENTIMTSTVSCRPSSETDDSIVATSVLTYMQQIHISRSHD